MRTTNRWDKASPLAKWEQQQDPEERWKRKLQQARDTSPYDILLGKNLVTQLPVNITLEDLLNHMHVVGATGVGKSYFIEGILKCLILLGHGVCVIDPTGDLYNRLMDFCAYLHLLRPELKLANRVIPFDVAETKQIIGSNPV